MNLSIAPLVQSDLHEIRAYIDKELENAQAASHTIEKLIVMIRKLSEFPYLGVWLSSKISAPTDYRYVLVGAHLIFYRHENDHLFVLCVLHSRRNYIKILFGTSRE